MVKEKREIAEDDKLMWYHLRSYAPHKKVKK